MPWTNFEPGAWSLTQYLRFGYVGGESTIYAYVGKLAQATWRAYACGARSGGAYFNPNEPSAESSGDSVARTRALVTRAVRRQLVADVPLGCFLSGGTDSRL